MMKRMGVDTMPRGVKRTEIEIIQAEIRDAEKKREQGMRVANDAKKAITKLQNKIDQEYAKEIAKACRAAGIPLKEVLAWVQTRQKENLSAEKPEDAVAEPVKKRSPAKKAKPASARAKKAASASTRARKAKAAGKPKKAADSEASAEPASPMPDTQES